MTITYIPLGETHGHPSFSEMLSLDAYCYVDTSSLPSPEQLVDKAVSSSFVPISHKDSLRFFCLSDRVIGEEFEIPYGVNEDGLPRSIVLDRHKTGSEVYVSPPTLRVQMRSQNGCYTSDIFSHSGWTVPEELRGTGLGSFHRDLKEAGDGFVLPLERSHIYSLSDSLIRRDYFPIGHSQHLDADMSVVELSNEATLAKILYADTGLISTQQPKTLHFAFNPEKAQLFLAKYGKKR